MPIPHLLLILFASAITVPAFADAQGDRAGAKVERKRSAAVKNQENPAPPVEEPRRLRGDILEYYREAYPDSSLFQARRNMMRERMSHHLSEVDSDQDGGLSREEIKQNMPALARHFDTIDANGDGLITRDEIEHARARMFQGRMDR